MAVAVAVVSTLAVIWALVGADLRTQVDVALRQEADRIVDERHLGPSSGPEPRETREVPAQQLAPDGTGLLTTLVFASEGPAAPTPVGPDDALPALRPLPPEIALVAAGGGAAYADTTIEGRRLRLYATAVADGTALVIGRNVEDVDAHLRRLVLILAAVGVLGIAGAGLLGWYVSRAVTRPVTQLATEVRGAAADEGLEIRVPSDGPDELAQLGRSVNGLVEKLRASLDAQRQLMADASHELRSPLTSLRTNIEVLNSGVDLGDDDRASLTADITAQVREVGHLIDDLVVLSQEGPEPALAEPVALDELVEGALARTAARARAAQVRLRTHLEPSAIWGVHADLERAVVNVLDNAIKWSPPGGTIETRLAAGHLTVRDEGPGIAGADVAHVFERFYRADAARGLPGSGLGLAITRKIIDEHRGAVTIEQPAEGGTLVRIVIPPTGDPPSR